MSKNQSPQDNTTPLTKEEIKGLTEFIKAMRDLVEDVLDQGYAIKDGKLIPPSEDDRPQGIRTTKIAKIK